MHVADLALIAAATVGSVATVAMSLWAQRSGSQSTAFTMTSAVVIDPAANLTVLSRERALSNANIPLDALAGALVQHDISLSSIEIVSTSSRAVHTAASVLRQLFGPLPAVPHRTTAIVIQFDADRNESAIIGRGGGRPGAEAALRIATGRIGELFARRGIPHHLASASELSEILTYPTVARLGEYAAAPDRAIPAGGCGQLIGAGLDGTAVAANLVGTVSVSGSPTFLRQVVFRAVGAGARVAIYSTAVHSWSPLVSSLSDPERLTLLAPGERFPEGFDTAVCDESTPTRSMHRR